MKEKKTNAMRVLDTAHISYSTHHYDYEDGEIDGLAVARKIGEPVEKVFKTLVAMGPSKQYYVFIIPVNMELDLKAAARAVKEKSIALIPVADIQRVTGYIRGGCSPFGMKKLLTTVLDEHALALQQIIVSAGKKGQQIELSPQDLLTVIKGSSAPVVAD